MSTTTTTRKRRSKPTEEKQQPLVLDDKATVYVGLKEFLLKETQEYRTQVASLQLAIDYAQERAKNPNENITKRMFH